MKILGVHPGPLMCTKIFLRLEPLGLGLVAVAARDPLLADHERPMAWQIPLPPEAAGAYAGNASGKRGLYIHAPRSRAGRAIDAATEEFVDATRIGISP